MRRHEQCTARSFIRAARLDSHQPVFDDVRASDTICRRYFIQFFDKLYRPEILTVHRHRNSRFESDFDARRFVGRGRGRHNPLPHAFFRRVRWILEPAAFVAQVPDIPIAAVDIGLCLLNGNVVGFGVSNRVLARNDVPLTPRRDDAELRRQSFCR